MFIFYIFVLIFTTLLILVAYWYYVYYKLLGHLNIDGPKVYPFVGAALEFGNSSTFIPVSLEQIRKHGKSYKSIVGFHGGIITIEPSKIERFLSSPTLIAKSRIYRFLRSWLRDGLLLSKGEKWQKRRKMITPSYHFEILQTFVERFDSMCNILIEKLKSNEVGKNSTNIYPYITLCALDIITETAMGISANAQLESDSEYVRNVKELCIIVGERIFAIPSQISFIYPFTKTYWKERRALKVVHKFTGDVIRSRRMALKTKQKEKILAENDVDVLGSKRRKAFLDCLLEATIDGKPLTDADIQEEVDTFMFEGHDTTASSMTFTLYCLASNPEIQTRVLEEQRDIFENNRDRPPSYRDLQEMKYLEMVIKESLRLYPSVPFIGRYVHEDTLVDDLLLKEGTHVLLYIYGLHMDEEFFPNPTKFDPDRFTTENSKGRHPYAYIPFSAGSRNCIGQKFAMLEIKSTISKIIRNFELKPAVPSHQLKLVAETILKTSDGVSIQIKNRIW